MEASRQVGETRTDTVRDPHRELARQRAAQDDVSPVPTPDRTGDQTAAPWSSAQALLKYSGRWQGNAVERLLDEVYASRGHASF
ncbi:MAG: hypothetical protein ACR2PL_00745 [Dehalococcoidia bacterium]